MVNTSAGPGGQTAGPALNAISLNIWKTGQGRIMDNNREQSAANAPMDQVREILFGAQLKDMEIRFKRQEERFVQEISDVRDSFKKRLDSLENFMKSEVSGLLERLRRESEEREAALKAERQERNETLAGEQRERAEVWQQEQRERIEAVKNEERERQESAARLASDLAAAAAGFERKLAHLSQTLDSAERDLRTLLMGESASLTDKIERKYSDALRALAKTNVQIRNDMVYRAALSGLLAETVGGLAKPWNAEALAGALEETPEAAAGQPAPEETREEFREDLPQVARLGSADNY